MGHFSLTFCTIDAKYLDKKYTFRQTKIGRTATTTLTALIGALSPFIALASITLFVLQAPLQKIIN